MVHAYHLRLQGIDIAMAPCNAQGKYRIGDVVWVKTLHSKCADTLRIGHVIEIISPLSVQVDGVPHHVKDLRPVVGSKPSDDESDSGDCERLVYLNMRLQNAWFNIRRNFSMDDITSAKRWFPHTGARPSLTRQQLQDGPEVIDPAVTAKTLTSARSEAYLLRISSPLANHVM